MNKFKLVLIIVMGLSIALMPAQAMADHLEIDADLAEDLGELTIEPLVDPKTVVEGMDFFNDPKPLEGVDFVMPPLSEVSDPHQLA